ncbi:ATP-dependent DNA helicase RecG [Actinobacillus equuli]|nr:ATP-dependent DNA helicase RecG [Actinobacillus equuli]
MIIGTHALFQESVEFHNLALVIIDEQHRFGVHQRLTLREKARKTAFIRTS